MPTPTPTPRIEPSNRATTALGIVVFLVGVGLIGYVFVQASQLYHTPPPKPVATPTPLPQPGASPLPPENPIPGTTATLIRETGSFVQQLLALLVMCIAGSAVAALGVRLFRR